MKKWMSAAAAAAALTLTASCALAATADAKIVAPNTEKITAPFAGTLLPFDAEQGDSVSAGETLFTLDTVPVYAAQAGTVSAVFANVGDDASGVAAHYGALAVVEPKNALYIDASTEQAYDDADNRYIHAGESLYLKMGNTKGTGVVTGVSGKKYTVEILTGDYDVNDTVRCFRESTAPSDSEVGRGKVTRYADVQVLADSGRIADRYRMKLEVWGVPYEEGGHSEERILAASECVKSPGIPDSAPIVRKLRERGVPVISEIEFAGRYLDGARTICITGSNGKTTTTSLVYRILRDAGCNVALGGNIGESFAYSVATGDYDWYVLELSSFQLDGMYKFRAHIGVLMNITPDHLDRYGYCFQNYIDSKMRIIRNQHSRCAFVYSADDPVIAAELPKYDLRMRQLPFAAHTAIASGAGDAVLDSDGTFVASVGRRSVEIATSEMKIHGLHNAYNAMAAALATLAAGVEPEQVRRSILSFEGVEHRLERVLESADGVLFINDSKATNVDSVWYALESMQRPTVWIAGGTDKGNDYAPLMDFARQKVHTLVCMGVDNRKLIDSFTGVVPQVIDTHSLDEAMQAACRAARKGDTVLLSPACASFDLFKNYEHRGEEFKRWVNEHVKR